MDKASILFSILIFVSIIGSFVSSIYILFSMFNVSKREDEVSEEASHNTSNRCIDLISPYYNFVNLFTDVLIAVSEYKEVLELRRKQAEVHSSIIDDDYVSDVFLEIWQEKYKEIIKQKLDFVDTYYTSIRTAIPIQNREFYDNKIKEIYDIIR